MNNYRCQCGIPMGVISCGRCGLKLRAPDVIDPIAAAHARGVAEERARCIREVQAERERWSSQSAKDSLWLVIERIQNG